MSMIGGCPCGCDDCLEPSGADASQFVRDWIERERCKPTGLKADEIALLERCAEDLEVGV